MSRQVSRWLKKHYRRIVYRMDGASDRVVYEPKPIPFSRGRARWVRLFAAILATFVVARLFLFLILAVLS